MSSIQHSDRSCSHSVPLSPLFLHTCATLSSTKHQHQFFTAINHSRPQRVCVRVRVCQTHQGALRNAYRVSHKNTSLSKRILLCVSEHKLQQHEYKWASWLSVIWLSGYSKQQISERRWVIWQNNSTFPKWLRGGGSQSFVSERRREEFSCGNERNKKICRLTWDSSLW